MIRKSIREIEREMRKLETSCKQITNETRKVATQGKMNEARMMARDLVRTRKHIERMYRMKTQLTAVNLRVQTIKSQNAMTEAMRGVTRAMLSMNRQINLPGLQQIMMEFERQSEFMDMKEESINDTMEEMYDDDNEEEETDDIINQVLDEIGINLNTQLVDTPGGEKVESGEKAPEPKQLVAENDVDSDLISRFNNLKQS